MSSTHSSITAVPSISNGYHLSNGDNSPLEKKAAPSPLTFYNNDNSDLDLTTSRKSRYGSFLENMRSFRVKVKFLYETCIRMD